MSKECFCNEKFRDAEDYRDHLPCPGSKEANQERDKIIRWLIVEAGVFNDKESQAVNECWQSIIKNEHRKAGPWDKIKIPYSK